MPLLKKVIILAGGLGTRLSPLTNNIPKPMVLVQGKLTLHHIIENLKRYGIKEIILSVGYKAEKIKEYFGDGSSLGVKITYSTENKPLGTGGAIKQAAAGLTEPFFLVWGDCLTDINFIELYQTFINNQSLITMAVTKLENIQDYSLIKIEEQKVKQFVEKPELKNISSGYIDIGIYIISPECLKILPTGKSSIEKDCFEKIVQEGKITAYFHQGQWFPTDTLERYYHACQNFESNF